MKNSVFFNAPVTVETGIQGDTLHSIAMALAELELRRLEEAFDPYHTEGKLYRLNTNRRVRDEELYEILQRGVHVFELTSGAFGLYGWLLERAYQFDRTFPEPPSERRIQEIQLAMRRGRIDFSPSRFQISTPNDAYQISLTHVRNGYAADQVLALIALAEQPVARVMIGPVIACGESLDGRGWPVDIPHIGKNRALIRLYVEDAGVATASVNDEAYTYRNQLFYNHLDPDTGRPVDGLLSATVVAPSAEMAQALASSVFVMGLEEGLGLLNTLPEVEGIFLTTEGETFVTTNLSYWEEER